MNSKFKCGFVSIIGRPNVGKSTLINHLIGQKVAITSAKPQTTRTNMKGVLTTEKGQIIFIDTPGLHKPHHLLGEKLVKSAIDSLNDIEVILFLVDGTSEVGGGDRYIVENILKNVDKTPVYLLINKIDKINKREREKFLADYSSLYDFKKVFLISAKHGDNLENLTNDVFDLLPEGTAHYDEEYVTDTPMRDVAGELIREQIFRLFGEEIPHSTAIFVDSYQDDYETNLTTIRATIYVERNSQKGIVIGKGATKLKEIGKNARLEIEKMIGNKVFLELHVKVLKNWRKDEKELEKLGYIIG